MKKVIGITSSIGSGRSYAVSIIKQICKEKKIKAIFMKKINNAYDLW